MSDAATKDRAIKRHWAEPGSRHDKTVRAAKFGLPIVIGGLVLLLAIAPFEQKGEVSFILDKNKVDEAAERMRVESARYVGRDEKNQAFEVVANRAVQPSSDVPIVSIEGIRASLAMPRGAVSIDALRGRYDLDNEQVSIDGPVQVAGPDGYSLNTRDVTVDMGSRRMQSKGAVTGTMELGEFSAGRLSADLEARTVTLDQGVRLKIRQGAVR
ncbi:LPS export ABC transporter periplasmic protein LptC [Sphingomonas sp. LY29]|uniref:LPS export ABC transporter periplasmic protein LptC n=1 Tax=Sphingomonas sp. LY29 TaxID=3095341 RepID=UPI002D7857D8|nr:LPS export ABC transporter periplasmic protein LptC [Sphingomonas sp. LY29]WRP24995.1 LPS export ABC transporter periplasmic protein LptC [Sphingomonas sp. LY29]